MRFTTEQKSGAAGEPWFTTTHWSVVLTAGAHTGSAAREALEILCRTYWYPLYAYVRRQGHSAEEAQDLTQEFFARFIQKHSVSLADPARGRFRTFLLTALKHFLVNEWVHHSRQKRGGGQQGVSWNVDDAEPRYRAEPADAAAPDVIYERRWAGTLLDRAVGALRDDQASAGKAELLDRLQECLWGETDAPTYAEIAASLGITEGAVKVAAHRLRRRFRELLRNEVAHTVGRPEEVDEELQHLSL